MSSNPSVTSASGMQRSDHGPGGGGAGQWARRAMKRALVTAEPLSERQVVGVVRCCFCGAFQSFYEHFFASSRWQLHRWRGRAIIRLAEAVGFRGEELDPGLDFVSPFDLRRAMNSMKATTRSNSCSSAHFCRNVGKMLSKDAIRQDD